MPLRSRGRPRLRAALRQPVRPPAPHSEPCRPAWPRRRKLRRTPLPVWRTVPWRRRSPRVVAGRAPVPAGSPPGPPPGDLPARRARSSVGLRCLPSRRRCRWERGRRPRALPARASRSFAPGRMTGPRHRSRPRGRAARAWPPDSPHRSGRQVAKLPAGPASCGPGRRGFGHRRRSSPSSSRRDRRPRRTWQRPDRGRSRQRCSFRPPRRWEWVASTESSSPAAYFVRQRLRRGTVRA